MSKVDQWLKRRGISPSLARECGVRPSPDETQIAYPRLNDAGERVGWKIRNIETGAQFNHPGGIPVADTVPFTSMRGKDAAILCEGETDTLRLASKIDESGVDHGWEIMCVPGSSAFPAAWAGVLAKWNLVYVIPDGDDAGRTLAQKVSSLVPRARYVKLPDNLDLSDYLKDHSIKDLLNLMTHSGHLSTNKVQLRHDKYKSPIDIDPSALTTLVLKDTLLKRRGKEFVGRCPFHKEKTPSFMVDPKKGLYYCHGCHRGGDAIKYLQDLHGLTWGQAARKVKDCS